MTNQPYPPNGSRAPEARARREAHWRDVLARWKTSGLSKADYGRREKISVSVLSWWDAELRRRDRTRRRTAARAPRSAPMPLPKRAAFIPVRVVEPAATAIEFVAGGRTIRVRPGFDPETLKQLVAALEDRSC
ncbi:MAG: hypothetical protein AABX97_04960 [Candidatus Thermoplasmatota archaeon]